MNLPIPQIRTLPKSLQMVINMIVKTIATLIGWQIDSVANLASFATVDDTRIPDGSGKFVRTLLDTFHLDKTSTATVDGITVVATMSGTGRWVRDLQPNATWGSQGTFYVDPVTGSDENTGLTNLVPLATFAEARRRLEPIGVLVDTTIYIMSDLAVDDPVGINCSGEVLTIEGISTTLYSGTVAAYTKNPSTNTPGTLSDAAWTVATYLHKHIRFTSGAADDMGAWILEADYGGAGNARLSAVIEQVYGYPGTAAPGVGDTFVVEDFPTVTMDGLVAYSGIIRMAYLSHREVETQNVVFRIAPNYNSVFSGFLAVNFAAAFVDSGSLYVSDCLGGGYPVFFSSVNIVGGATKFVDGESARILVYRESIVDHDVPGGGGVLGLFKHTGMDAYGDLWLYGDFGTRAIYIVDAVLNMSGTRIRGDITGTTQLSEIDGRSSFTTTRDDHTVVNGAGNTNVSFVGANGAAVDVNDGGIGVPYGAAQFGTTTEMGAIGSKDIGIKGVIGAANVYALPDFTSSATNDLPFVVTNKSFARNLRIRLGTAPGGVATVVATLYVNGAPTAVTCTVTGTDTTSEDVTHSVLVQPGDEVALYVESSAATAADLSAAFEVG